jgi:CheY-like chemotaxis protein
MSQDILIVNGSPERRRLNREILERAGYPVREVVSPDQAVRAARVDPPIAVVLEAVPGGRDVPDRLADRLRRYSTTREIPLLVLGDMPAATPRASEGAPVSYLPEPCPTRMLLEEVAYLTRPRPVVDRFFGAPEASPSEPPKGTTFREHLYSRTRG